MPWCRTGCRLSPLPHAPCSPSPARATRAMTDGSLRMARPFQGRRDPAHVGCSLAHLYLALPCPINAEGARRRLIHPGTDGFFPCSYGSVMVAADTRRAVRVSAGG